MFENNKMKLYFLRFQISLTLFDFDLIKIADIFVEGIVSSDNDFWCWDIVDVIVWPLLDSW